MTEQITALSQTEILDLDAMDLMDIDISLIPDSPEFIKPYSGLYSVSLKMSKGTYDAAVYVDGKDTGEKKESLKLGVICTIKDVLDITEDVPETDRLPTSGDLFMQSYFGVRGAQDLVTDMRSLMLATGLTTVGTLTSALTTNSVDAVVEVKRSMKVNKETKEKYAVFSFVNVMTAEQAQALVEAE